MPIRSRPCISLAEEKEQTDFACNGGKQKTPLTKETKAAFLPNTQNSCGANNAVAAYAEQFASLSCRVTMSDSASVHVSHPSLVYRTQASSFTRSPTSTGCKKTTCLSTASHAKACSNSNSSHDGTSGG